MPNTPQTNIMSQIPNQFQTFIFTEYVGLPTFVLPQSVQTLNFSTPGNPPRIILQKYRRYVIVNDNPRIYIEQPNVDSEQSNGNDNNNYNNNDYDNDENSQTSIDQTDLDSVARKLNFDDNET